MHRFLMLAGLILLPALASAREWNVAEAGAVGDGKMDCTAVFQQVLDQAGAEGGGIVKVPTGRYRIDGTLKIPGAVTLQGEYRNPPTPEREARPELDGSVLLAYAGRGNPDAAPFVTLAGSKAVIAGLMIFYPEWKPTDVPPVPYPPTIFAGLTVNVGVYDLNIVNPYEAIRFVRASRFNIRNVFGHPSWRGLYVDWCVDIGKIENCHFWPFSLVYRTDDPLCRWIGEHGVAFEFARYDWCYVLNTFCFGYGIGYKFSRSPLPEAVASLTTTNGQLLGIGADCCKYAIYVEETQGPGLQITNAELVGSWVDPHSVPLYIAENAKWAAVTLNNCSFWGPIDRCIWAKSPNGRLIVNACNFLQWDAPGTGAPAVQIDAGKAVISSNMFNGEGLAVLVGEKARSAIVTSNLAAEDFRIDNRAGSRTQAAFNDQDTVEWAEGALRHYRLSIGEPGDARYLRGFNGRESAPEWGAGAKMRWSGKDARLIVPVEPGTTYTVTLELNVPAAAQASDNGLYLGERRIAHFPEKGMGVASGVLPPQTDGQATLSLRVGNWVPKDVEPGNQDTRTLGARVHGLTLQAVGAAEGRVFSANGGEWIGKQ